MRTGRVTKAASANVTLGCVDIGPCCALLEPANECISAAKAGLVRVVMVAVVVTVVKAVWMVK